MNQLCNKVFISLPAHSSKGGEERESSAWMKNASKEIWQNGCSTFHKRTLLLSGSHPITSPLANNFEEETPRAFKSQTNFRPPHFSSSPPLPPARHRCRPAMKERALSVAGPRQINDTVIYRGASHKFPLIFTVHIHFIMCANTLKPVHWTLTHDKSASSTLCPSIYYLSRWIEWEYQVTAAAGRESPWIMSRAKLQ